MASSKHKYESCSLQIKLPDSYIETLQQWSNTHISDDLIYQEPNGTYGRDTRNHVTISIGLKEDQFTKCAAIAPECYGIKIATETVKVFENDKFDVILLGVREDDILNGIQKQISALADSKLVRRKFTPHVSIAFLKKGYGKKVVKQLSWHDRQSVENFEWEIDEIEMTTQEGGFLPVPKIQ
jgi:hypothetical protein